MTGPAPDGYAVVATAPYRSPSVHEIRYDPVTLGRAGQIVAGRARLLTTAEWLAARPQIIDQPNPPG